jgi:ATP-dependent DNA ligase
MRVIAGCAAYHRSAMTDQLSLRLETDLPKLPRTLRPMLARPAPAPFDSADHLFEPSWGGLRALAFVGPAATAGSGDVRIVDVDGVPVGGQLPELAGLAVRVDARSAVLDGELVVVDPAGRADPAQLTARILGRPGRPVAYLAFDLLHLDGRSLLSVPLDRRRTLLRRVLRPGDEVVAVPAIQGEGRALWEAATAQGIAGVMARQRTSPYLPGIRSRLWRWIAIEGAGGPAAAEVSVEGPAGTGSGPDATTNGADGVAPGPANAPVIALIRRLPLLEADDGPSEAP